MKSYAEITQWLFSQLPVYQNQGATAYKPGLNKIINFVASLGNPHHNYPSIHIAGTNGKGSTAHMIASVLQESGSKIGLYTSPHLLDFSERIRIDGQTIEEEFVIAFVQKHQGYFLDEGLSFFEITVGMAFAYFAQQRVDYAVIEVGLGGRLDATNIITPILSVITNIGLDHTQLLGQTHAAIAVEKAGIIKSGIPVVIGEWREETRPVFERIAEQKNAPILLAEKQEIPELSLDLHGQYQIKNAQTAYTALEFILGKTALLGVLDGFRKVYLNTGLRGRWEILANSPLTIADVTHNLEGFIEVLAQLKYFPKKQLHFVLGFVEGKTIDEIVALLPRTAKYYVSSPQIARGFSTEKLAVIMKKKGLKAQSFTSVGEAYLVAQKAADKTDLIYIGGSAFVVSEIIA